MKKIFLLILVIGGFTAVGFSQDPASAQKGVTYGDGTTEQGALTVRELEKKVVPEQPFEGKVKGKVVSVCEKKGCWMTLENTGGEKVMVKFREYAFFMPKDIVGKEVVLDGEANLEEVSVKQLQHYAADAGKSKQEIAKIKAPKKELNFVAKGVLVL